ncbi:VanW family protein [Aciduricibacillus chroicocephali]|uniref:VanW family protein n=1 Tax=Aciduricibacillus chroicocephali TaxID=3054939 RepID=A0ABY9KY69_9BACI|nr:VanW family protein [Bacillaceae bacterium 44XB]
MFKFLIAIQTAFQFTHFPPEELTIFNEKGKPVQQIQREEAYHFLEDPLFINTRKIDELAAKLNEEVYQAPENAKLGEGNVILPEKTGRELDRQGFKRQYLEFLMEGREDSFKIPTKAVHPRVTAEILSEIQGQKIGSYTTYFPDRNKERTLNIKLAAKAIDSHVVFPGEQFSFNKVVGERTEERGYERAPVIIKGEFAEDIGGGICQVSSTLFNAVNLQGIKIIERYMHSRDVSYVPPGKDATVSWNGPDFVFVNSYNEPILIRASANNGKMHITIQTAEGAQAK